MKHVARISKSVPAMAAIVEDHPSAEDAIKGFIEDPQGTLQLHLDALMEKIPVLSL